MAFEIIFNSIPETYFRFLDTCVFLSKPREYEDSIDILQNSAELSNFAHITQFSLKLPQEIRSTIRCSGCL